MNQVKGMRGLHPFSICFLVAGFLTSANSNELSESNIRKIRRACVEIRVDGQLRGGGAFVKDENGKTFVITAAHLFPNPKSVCSVLTSDDTAHFGSLVAYDLGHDLALIDVDNISRFGALSIAPEIPTETKPIFNFGPALRRRTLAVPGKVADSRISYTDFSSSGGYLANYFVGGINPTLTSGGIWVDEYGQIVGIQHGRLIGDKSPSSGISLVSPPTAIRALLKSKNSAQTPCLGGFVWEVWTADHDSLARLPRDLQGLIVKQVFADRALDRAGLKVEDVIVKCNGVAIKRRHHLLDLIRDKPLGTEFTLEFYRPSKRRYFSAKLVTDALETFWH
ncbi:MAG: S1C family serine protease [Verrucomicrobiota bacterium]